MRKREAAIRENKLEELKRLKKEGKSRLESYKPEFEEIYDEVPEDAFNVMNSKMRNDDFIVDDDGLGYVDNGIEEDEYYSDEGEEDEKTAAQIRLKQNLTKSFFGASSKKPEKKIKKKTNDGFFNSLIGTLDDESLDAPIDSFPSSLTTLNVPKVENITNNATNSDIVATVSLDNTFDISLEPEFEQQNLVEIKTAKVNVQTKAKAFEFKSLKKSAEKKSKEFSSFPQLSNAPKIAVSNVETPTSSLAEKLVFDEDILNFYWFDSFEKRDGAIFLFGKAMNSDGKFISACVCLKNVNRNLFFLPRDTVLDTEDEVTLESLSQEISEIARQNKIKKFAMKKCSRKYAFEVPDIPDEADYMKFVYSFEYPQLPSNLNGKCFSHIFGTNSSALELFLMKRNIMGPCWLSIKTPNIVKKNFSWCKLEIEVEDPKSVSIMQNEPPAPPFKVLSLSLKTLIDSERHMNEIVSFGAVLFNQVPVDSPFNETNCSASFTCVRPAGSSFPVGFLDSLKSCGTKIEAVNNERALLNYLIATIKRHDPDIIVGHNFLGFDLDVLLHRMKACKVDYWSRLGRLVWKNWPKMSGVAGSETNYQEKLITSGRLICDTYLAAKDLIKSKNYSLETLAACQLGRKRVEFNRQNVRNYCQTSDGLTFVARHCEEDSYLSALLAFNLMVLPLTKQLTNLAGNIWSRTLAGARAERNEYLLMHEFHNRKFIIPDKASFAKADGKKGRKKAAYTGGLVLEPKKGLYDSFVLLLDFNSLYPSIIQEYNICFTTVQRTADDDDENPPEIPDKDLERGVLPAILSQLVSRRRQVKSLMKDSAQDADYLKQLDIRQRALKLTANSMYGCLGFVHSRFYAKPLAMLITHKGREILQNTVQIAENVHNLEVIYGDTDSIMINTGRDNIADIKVIGNQLKKSVNEKYKLIEIEMDGIFSKLLLLKKKKYAALVISEHPDGSIKKTVEMKGLDLVRRDWCSLSVEISQFVLDCILSDRSSEDVVSEIHKHLTFQAQMIRGNEISLNKFVISKNLTKNPEEYADGKTQPHVRVAMVMKAKGLSANVGDTIPYVVCKGDDSVIAMRAYHPDEFKSRTGDSKLELDFEWYVSQQIHPPVTRLCEHIEGTDSGRIADCLGLDSSKYNKVFDGSSFFQSSCRISDEEKFKNVKKVEMNCPNCQSINLFKGGVFKEGEEFSSGLICSNPSCRIEFSCQFIVSVFKKAALNFIKDYYDAEMVCDDPICGLRTRKLRVYEKRCQNESCRGSMLPVVSNQDIYIQLLYFQKSFSVSSLRKKLGDKAFPFINSLEPKLSMIEDYMSKIVAESSYPIVNLTEIFSQKFI